MVWESHNEKALWNHFTFTGNLFHEPIATCLTVSITMIVVRWISYGSLFSLLEVFTD